MIKNLNKFVLSALFTALISICSQIVIPLSVIPVNLALFAVYISGAVLGEYYGALSVITYILIGMAGLPVFAGFKGGIGIILGPTGGYIIGYIFTVFVSGLIIHADRDKIILYPLGMGAGLIICYLFGTLWYSIAYGVSFISAVAVCVVPFLIGDILKIILASFLSFKLNGILKKKTSSD